MHIPSLNYDELSRTLMKRYGASRVSITTYPYDRTIEIRLVLPLTVAVVKLPQPWTMFQLFRELDAALEANAALSAIDTQTDIEIHPVPVA